MLEAFAQVLLSNAVMATALGVLAYAISRLFRRPAVTHALWAVVLLKLVTPPVWHVPVGVGREIAQEATAAPPPATVQPPGPQKDPAVLEAPSPIAAAPVIIASPPLDVALPGSDLSQAVMQPSSDPPSVSKPAAAPLDSEIAENSAAVVATAEAAIPSTQPPKPFGNSDHWRQVWQWVDPAFLFVLFGSISLIGSGLCAMIIVLRLIRFRSALRHAQAAPPELLQCLQKIAPRMGIEPPQAHVIRGAVSPMVFALFGRPRLLVPIDLWTALDPLQQSAMLAHELAHLKRGDHRLRWLELAVTIIYWWHPLVWLARRELHEAEEFCCDAWVAWLLPGSQQRYAAALLDAVDFASGLPLPPRSASPQPTMPSPIPAVPAWASGLNDFARLKRRLLMIKTSRAPRQMSWMSTGCVFAMAACVLPLSPLRGQEAPPEQPKQVTPGIVDQELPPPAVAEKPINPVKTVEVLPAPGSVEVLPAPVPSFEDVPAKLAAEAKPDAPLRPASADPSAVDQLKQARDQVAKLQSELTSAMQRLQELEGHSVQPPRPTAAPRAFGGGGATYSRSRSIGGQDKPATPMAPSTNTPGMALPRGVSPEGTYRVIDNEGRLLVYSLDGKLISAAAAGAYGVDKKSQAVLPSPFVAPAASSQSMDEMKKHLDRVDHDLGTLLKEVQQLRNELKSRPAPGTTESAPPAFERR